MQVAGHPAPLRLGDPHCLELAPRLLRPSPLGDVVEDRVDPVGTVLARPEERHRLDADQTVLGLSRVVDLHEHAGHLLAGAKGDHRGVLESREGSAVFAQRVVLLSDGARAQEVLRPFAQDPLGRGVHGDDGPVGVLVDDSLEHGVVQEPVALFALAQRLRGPLALGDVVEDGGEARSFERDRGDPEVPLQGLEVGLERAGFATLGDLRVLREVRGFTGTVGLAGASTLDRSRAHGGVTLEGRIDVGDDVVDRLSPLVDELVQSDALGHAAEEGAEALLVLAQRLLGVPALRLGPVQRG